MNQILATFIEEKKADAALISALEELSAEDAEAISVLLTATAPSANTLRAYLQLLKEISIRDEVSLRNILTDEILQELLASDSKLPRKEIQKQLRLHLENIRFPERKRISDLLEERRRTLVSATGLKLSLPSDYEGDSLSVSVSARSADEFRELARRFETLASHQACQEVFLILKGETIDA